jgi:hypothetical protein
VPQRHPEQIEGVGDPRAVADGLEDRERRVVQASSLIGPTAGEVPVSDAILGSRQCDRVVENLSGL